MNYVFTAAEVLFKMLDVRPSVAEMAFNMIENTPVAATKTIDTLFDVADEQTFVAAGHVFNQQFLEILPLEG